MGGAGCLLHLEAGSYHHRMQEDEKTKCRQELCHIGFLGLIKEFRLHSLRIENKDFIQRAEENFGGEGD